MTKKENLFLVCFRVLIAETAMATKIKTELVLAEVFQRNTALKIMETNRVKEDK